MNPSARKERLVIQPLGEEVIVYDLEINKAYSLNETTAFVWNNLDGETGTETLAEMLSVRFKQKATEEFVWLAIDELRKANLLEESSALPAMSRIERREVIKRAGLASMIALPMVMGLVAPTAAAAASELNCTNTTQCANNTISGSVVCPTTDLQACRAFFQTTPCGTLVTFTCRVIIGSRCVCSPTGFITPTP